MHTFSTRYFQHLAHTQPAHAGLWHLLGEVETVFGFWALLLLVFMALSQGWSTTSDYLDSRRFVEPMFVFVIMVMAASRPIMQLASDTVAVSRPGDPAAARPAIYFLSLSLVPLLGSLITEPAAMTLAALMLRDRIFSRGASPRLKYATWRALRERVDRRDAHQLCGSTGADGGSEVGVEHGAHVCTIGWKAAIAVLVNAFALTMMFRRELSRRPTRR